MKDKLGQPLDIGDEVVYPENNHLKFGTVMRILGDSGCIVVGYQSVKSRFSIIKVADHAEKNQ